MQKDHKEIVGGLDLRIKEGIRKFIAKRMQTLRDKLPPFSQPAVVFLRDDDVETFIEELWYFVQHDFRSNNDTAGNGDGQRGEK